MAAAIPSAALVPVPPVFTNIERLALAGFRAGYNGLTRQAYELDLSLFAAWCSSASCGWSPAAALTSNASPSPSWPASASARHGHQLARPEEERLPGRAMLEPSGDDPADPRAGKLGSTLPLELFPRPQDPRATPGARQRSARRQVRRGHAARAPSCLTPASSPGGFAQLLRPGKGASTHSAVPPPDQADRHACPCCTELICVSECNVPALTT